MAEKHDESLFSGAHHSPAKPESARHRKPKTVQVNAVRRAHGRRNIKSQKDLPPVKADPKLSAQDLAAEAPQKSAPAQLNTLQRSMRLSAEFTVPRQLHPGRLAEMEILLCEENAEQKHESRGSASRTVSSGTLLAERNTPVRVTVTSPELGFEETQSVVWAGGIRAVHFIAAVPKQCADAEVLLTAKVQFGTEEPVLMKAIACCAERAAQTLFISYCSDNRADVIRVIQGIQAAMPESTVLWDQERLKPNAVWRDWIYQSIDDCSVFFLCWSQAAQASEWVQRELSYALKKKGIGAIRLIPLENGIESPEGLSHLHSDDLLNFVFRAARQTEIRKYKQNASVDEELDNH